VKIKFRAKGSAKNVYYNKEAHTLTKTASPDLLVFAATVANMVEKKDAATGSTSSTGSKYGIEREFKFNLGEEELTLKTVSRTVKDCYGQMVITAYFG